MGEPKRLHGAAAMMKRETGSPSVPLALQDLSALIERRGNHFSAGAAACQFGNMSAARRPIPLACVARKIP